MRTKINVNVLGQAVQKQIDIAATSVDFFIFIVDENGAQSNEFDFGDVYFGQQHELQAFLVNNSPKRHTFKTKFLVGKQNAFVTLN